MFQVKEYQGKPLTLKSGGKVLVRLEAGDVLGVKIDPADTGSVHFLHGSGERQREFTMQSPASDRIVKQLVEYDASKRKDTSVNLLNNVRLSFQVFIREESRRFLPRWGISESAAQLVNKSSNTFWWEVPLELDSTDSIICRFAFIRDTFYYVLLFPKDIPNIKYRLSSPQVDAALELFNKMLDVVGQKNGQTFTLGSNFTMLPDTALRRVMPDSKHAFAFLKTNPLGVS